MTQEIESIGLSMDTSGVEKGIKSLETLAATGPKVEKAVAGVESAAAKAGKSLATLGQGGAASSIGNLGKAGEAAAAGISKTGSAAEKSAREIKNIDRAANVAGSSLSGLGAAAGIASRAVAAIGIAASAGEFVRLADASTNVASRLGLVTSSAAELASVQQRLFQVAQSSRVSFADLVGTYAQVARSTKDLGVSQNALLGVIQTISQAVTISGGSAASAQAALVQLSQGFAAGALRGEELNSIMEQTPRLAQAIADGLGVSVGKLRELGQAGELTAEKVLGALEKSAAGVAAEFGKMAVTVEQASTNAANSVLRLTGAFDRLLGVTSAIGGAIQSVSKGLDFLSSDVEKLGSQGALRAASREVINLDAAAKRLRTGMESGVLGPNAQAELDRINAQLAEAKRRFRELDQQLGGAKDPRDQSGFAGRGTSYANEAKRLAKLQEDANKFRLDQAGVPASYIKDMNELIRLNQAGVIVGNEYTEALKKQQDLLLQKTGVTKGAAAAANQEQNAYENLVASIRTKIAANEAEISGAGRLSDSDRLRIKLQEELSAGAKTLTTAHKARAMALLDILSAQEKEEARIKGLVASYKEEVETAEELARAYVEQGKAREAGRSAVSSYANGIDEANNALQFELSLMGMGERARNVALEQYRIELDLKKQIAAIDANAGFDEKQREEERAKARAAAAIATANASSRAFLEDWKTSVGKYDDIFRQGFADMLNNGKDGWKSFTKSLATTFKTTVADQLYKAFAQPFVVNIVGNLLGLTGSLGLSAASGAAAAASGGSALSGLGTLASGASLIAGNFGAGLTTGFSGLMAGNLGSTLGLGTGLIGSGATAGGIGTIVGALGPIALGIGALTAIIGKTKGETRTGGQFGVAFDGSVTNQRRGQTYTIEGQQFDRDFTNGLQTALKDGIAYRLEGDPVAQESAIREAVAGTATGINGFLKALGSSATLTGFSAGLETSGKGRGGVFAGGLLSTGQGFGESGRGDNYAGTLYEAFSTNSPDFKTALENFTLDLKQSTIQALQTVSDIPETVKKLLAQVDAEGLTEDAANKLLETINAQIVGVNQFKDALKGMGLDTLAALSFDAAAGLAEVSGGFDKLLGNLQTYYTNFFTGEEQRANLQRSLAQQLSDLGLQLPDINASNARDQFRALVSAAEKDMSEAGRKTYATLLSLSGAFASITEAAATTTQTLEQQRQAYYGALQDAVSARNKSLQSQLSAAQEVEGTLESLFDILRSNVRDLYGEVDGTRGMLAAQGNAFIDQALAAARKSGYLPDSEKLAEAIAAARGGLDGVAYTSQFAADRDRLVLAGKLSGLEKITEKQLTDAQKTVRALETQIDQGEQVLDYWRQQIEIASGTYDGIMSVEAAIQQLQTSLNPATGKPGGANTVGGGSTPASGTGAIPRTSYGAEEALGSFEKFKAWYTGLKSNADPSKLMGTGYEVPDWLKVSNFGADSYSEKDLFGSYLFFKNNPQYAQDYQQIIDTGRSSYATDGSTLQRTDLSKLPKEVADYYSGNRDELLATEGFGLDPVLAYQLYNFGPGQFGLDGKKQSFTEWLQNTKWTPQGLVSNNNVVDLAQMGYSNYNLPRWDTSTGNIIDLDGTIYSPDGKRLGKASQSQLDAVYGPGYKPTAGASTGGGDEDYLSAIKTNIESAINAGWTAQQLADGLISTGTTLQDVATAYGISVEQVKENLLAGGATNIPKFDIGTNYVPRDMLAYIHEGEAVVPKAYNPAAGGSGAGGNAELLAEVRALREAVAALQAAASKTAENTNLMPQLGRQFDTVTQGGTVMRNKAVA